MECSCHVCLSLLFHQSLLCPVLCLSALVSLVSSGALGIRLLLTWSLSDHCLTPAGCCLVLVEFCTPFSAFCPALSVFLCLFHFPLFFLCLCLSFLPGPSLCFVAQPSQSVLSLLLFWSLDFVNKEKNLLSPNTAVWSCPGFHMSTYFAALAVQSYNFCCLGQTVVQW